MTDINKKRKNSRVERVKYELTKLKRSELDERIPFTYITSDGYTLGRALTELGSAAKQGKISPEDLKELNDLGAHIKVGEKANTRYPFSKFVEDIKNAYVENGSQILTGDELCSDGKALSLRLDQYRASYRSGKINPKHQKVLEELGIELDVPHREVNVPSETVKKNILLFLKLFREYRKEHSHGYFENDVVIQGLNMRDWSERIRRISKCEKSSTPSPEVYQALLDAGFLLTDKECFMEKRLAALESYKNLNSKLPRRKDRNELGEPVGGWLRTVKEQLKDSTMSSTMEPRANKLLS